MSKAFFALLCLVLPTIATAAAPQVIDVTDSLQLMPGFAKDEMVIREPAASLVFQALKVRTVFDSDQLGRLLKATNSLVCYRADQVAKDPNYCTIPFDLVTGIFIDGFGVGKPDFVISFRGTLTDTVGQIFTRMPVQNTPKPDEPYTFVRSLSGFSCAANYQSQVVTCTVPIDSSVGAVK